MPDVHPGERPPKILVIGDVMIDILVRPEGPVIVGADRRATIRVSAGGSGANQAAWLAACGLRTIFAGRAGKADCAEQAKLLADSGVVPVLAADELLPTGTIVALLSADGERSFLTDRGANQNLCRADLPDALLDDIDLLHVSGYSLFDAGPRRAVLGFLGEARRRNIPLTVDPASYSFLQDAGVRSFLDWTRSARICFANSDEAAVLAGTSDPAAQLNALTQNYRLVVIKRGADGAMAGERGGAYWTVPAKAVGVVDTTGAGDAFLAGFLAAHLRGGQVEACLRAGVASASRAAATFGARPAAILRPAV